MTTRPSNIHAGLRIAVLLLATIATSALAQNFKVRTEFPSTNGRVFAMAVDDFNGIVYLGGAFTEVGGQPRSHLAAVDLATGALLPFAPQVNNTVYTLALSGITLYAGGIFTDVGGTTRKRAAAFQTTDGGLLSWDPNVVDGEVFTMAVDGTAVFLGGTFTQVGAVAVFRLAKVNASTGMAANWTPNPNVGVYAIAAYNGFAYTGGGFSSIGGKPYPYLATVDGGGTGDAFTGWFPNPNNTVYSLLFDDAKLYVGGDFSNFNSFAHFCLARVNRSTGEVDPDFPNFSADQRVSAMAISGSHLYLAGAFTQVSGSERRSLASIDTSSNTLNEWSPGANNVVDAISVSGYTVFVGGLFNTIGGSTRTGFAAIIDYSLPGAPLPDSPTGTPTITVKGKKKISTAKTSLTINGTSTSATRVEVTVGKSSKTAKGTTNWSFKVKLKPGKNAITVIAHGSGGDSAPAKIIVTRK